MTVDKTDPQGRTYYDVLGLPVLPKHVTLQEIKAAYHRALLTVHPDKVVGASGAELDLVRKAYEVLTDDVLRKEYDAKINVDSVTKNAYVTIDLDDMTYDEESTTYTFPCRCGTGGGFAITEEDLERGRDLVECRGCSSWIRVSYEMPKLRLAIIGNVTSARTFVRTKDTRCDGLDDRRIWSEI